MTTSLTDCVTFDHARIKKNEPVVDSMIASLGQHLVMVAVAPNFDVASPSASPTLHRAFDVQRQFRETVSSRDKPLPNGYALKLDGSMPIDSKERLDYVLGGWNQGLGTSLYKVTGLPPNLNNASDDEIAQLNADVRSKLPHIISPSHRVSLERTGNAFDKDQFGLFVTANDVAASRRLHQYVAARAAKKDPLTVETLMSSAEYKLLHERSQCARDTLASQYASAFGIQHSAEPMLTTQHYTILSANSLAHGTHASPVQQQAAREPRFFVVYNNASPTHEAHGGLIVSHGVMGGHTILEAARGEPWQQPRFLSLMPANSVESYDGHTQLTAEHRNATERSKAAFDARVTWHSELGDEFTHTSADEAYYSMNDAYSQRWLAGLSPTHNGPLRQRQYNLVAAQLPSVSTLYASPEQLGIMSRLEQTPRNIAVAIDNPIVPRITSNWDYIRKQGYKGELGQIFSSTFDNDEDDGFRVLSRASVCLNKAHAHSNEPADLYADAEKFNIISSTGCYRHLPLWMHMQWGNAEDHDDLDRFTDFDSCNEDFQSSTVLMLDKELIRLITSDIKTLEAAIPKDE